MHNVISNRLSSLDNEGQKGHKGTVHECQVRLLSSEVNWLEITNALSVPLAIYAVKS